MKISNNPKLLKKHLAKESKMGQADSLEILHEFEKIEEIPTNLTSKHKRVTTMPIQSKTKG